MEDRGLFKGLGFWTLALLWLPSGVVAQAAVRFLPATDGPPDHGMWLAAAPMAAASLAVLATLRPVPACPGPDPGALGCRRLWRLGYRRGAWWAGIALGAATVAVSVVAGLLGPVAIALYAIVVSLPVWGAWWWLVHRG